MTGLKDKRLFLLDMDGTIYLDEQLFDGTLDFLDYVKAIGGRAMYLTNNSSKSVKSYVDKLARLGITACEEDFLTSVNATVLYLQKQAYHKIYAFGTASFKSQHRILQKSAERGRSARHRPAGGGHRLPVHGF